MPTTIHYLIRLGLIIALMVIILPLKLGAAELESESDLVLEQSEATPGLELLLFLADFETTEGTWIDPTELETSLQAGWFGHELEVTEDE